MNERMSPAAIRSMMRSYGLDIEPSTLEDMENWVDDDGLVEMDDLVMSSLGL